MQSDENRYSIKYLKDFACSKQSTDGKVKVRSARRSMGMHEARCKHGGQHSENASS